MALSEKKIVKYFAKDPRYSLTIKDSDEYNTSIPPSGITLRCVKNHRPRNSALDVGCDSQRYENCVPSPLDDKYIECESIFGPPHLPTTFNPTKLNTSSFYSDTWLWKPLNPAVKVDRAPDVPKLTYNVTRDDVKKSSRHNETPDVIEHCVSLGVVKGGQCGVCGPLCCWWLPPWIAPEDACIICLCLCLLCLLLPCLCWCCTVL